MKNLPQITEPIASVILQWVRASDKVSASDVEIMAEFYQSLEHFGIKHDISMDYYRGLNLSENGILKLLETDHVKLKDNKYESWSCMFETAINFVEGSGVILKKNIPARKVIINLQQILEEYNSSKNLSDMETKVLRAIRVYDECELVTDTICTSCSVKEITDIKIYYGSGGPLRGMDAMDIFVDFWSRRKISRSLELLLETLPMKKYKKIFWNKYLFFHSTKRGTWGYDGDLPL